MGDPTHGGRRRPLVIVGSVAAVILALPGTAIAQTDLPGPVRIQATDDGILEVDGATRYLDTLELRRTGSGPMLINELGLDEYVAGIAEMPPRWPMEALKAQAVAARTYAWHVAATGGYDGYDICATTACQVFRGAEPVKGSPLGERWRQAVDETAGEVLVDEDGQPVLARYFSTSGGRTYANEEAFPSSGPRDHLVAIDDPYDQVSPFHHWTVRFSREEFDEILGRGETLAATVPVATVERIGAVDDPGARIEVTGEDGTRVDVDARDFQRFVSSVAPDRFPERFPQRRADGMSLLPSTVPSSRFAVRVGGEEVVLDGQGWGHGVGLGQYGARGRAEDGHDYQRILQAYYNGLQPTVPSDRPARIRVGLEPVTATAIRGDGPMRITAGDRVLAEGALGTWTVRPDGDAWALEPPAGYDQPIEVTATRSATNLGALDDAVAVEVDVNKPVILTLEVTDADGAVVMARQVGVAEAGTHAAVWRLETADGALAGPGPYRVALVGVDASGARDGSAMEVSIPLTPRAETDDPGGGSADGSPPAGAPAGSRRLPAIVLAVGALAIAGALAVGGALTIRRTR